MPEANITLEEYVHVSEFVKKKLKDDGRINIFDIKDVAPSQFNDQALLLSLLVDILTDIGEDIDALIFEYDPDLDEFRVITPKEYDPHNPRHILLDELELILFNVPEDEDGGDVGSIEDEVWD